MSKDVTTSRRSFLKSGAIVAAGVATLRAQRARELHETAIALALREATRIIDEVCERGACDFVTDLLRHINIGALYHP